MKDTQSLVEMPESSNEFYDIKQKCIPTYDENILWNAPMHGFKGACNFARQVGQGSVDAVYLVV